MLLEYMRVSSLMDEVRALLPPEVEQVCEPSYFSPVLCKVEFMVSLCETDPSDLLLLF